MMIHAYCTVRVYNLMVKETIYTNLDECGGVEGAVKDVADVEHNTRRPPKGGSCRKKRTKGRRGRRAESERGTRWCES